MSDCPDNERPRPQDAEARERIVSRRGISLSVEAGAGTGKTTLLVDHVIERLAHGMPLDRLAIITFTRKAAAELQARLRAAVETRLSASLRDSALARFEHATIGTTDSFCRELLARATFESAAPVDFSIVDEISASAIRERAWDNFLTESDSAHERLLAGLASEGLERSTIEEVALALLRHRDFRLPDTLIPGSAPADGALESAIQGLEDVRPLCTNPEDKLLQRVEEALQVLGAVLSLRRQGIPERIALAAMRRQSFDRSRTGQLKVWESAEALQKAHDALRVADQFAEDIVRARRLQLTHDLVEWMRSFPAEYDRAKQDRGVLDFADLALLTRDLLRTQEHVRRRLAGQFDEILLDEVQDSDPLQMEIAFLLAAEHVDREDSFASRLSPGKLFFVGDPKQSIYRFRRADIELYGRARERIAKAGGAETIQVNFRSHPSILEFVNRVFRGWMVAEPGTHVQADVVDLLPGRSVESFPEVGPRVHLLLPASADLVGKVNAKGATVLNAEAVDRADRSAVVRCIQHILEQGESGGFVVLDPESNLARAPQPRDIAVLVPRIAPGERLREALESVGVQATVSGGPRFYAREEIVLLTVLLQTIVDPEDEAAEFAALRSPVFGFDDNTLVKDRLGRLPQDAAATRLAEARSLLGHLGQRARETTVPDFLAELLETVSLVALLGLRPDGPSRISSLLTLVDAAESLESAGLDTLPEFVEWLTAQEAETRAEPPGELEDLDGNAVRILTMHKSKGLEFPIVILTDLGAPPHRSDSVVPRRSEGTLAVRWKSAEAAFETPDFAEAADEEKRRAEAERVRLLYVAMTRARDHLVFSWVPGPDTRKNAPGYLGDPPLVREFSPEVMEASGLVRVLRAEELPAVETRSLLSPVDPKSAKLAAVDLPSRLAPWSEERQLGLRGSRVVPASSALDFEGDLYPGREVTLRSPFWGAPFGTLIHRSLEALNLEAWRTSAESALLREALEEGRATLLLGEKGPERDFAAALSTDDVDSILKYLQRVTGDPAVRAILGAAQVNREVPLLLPWGNDFLSAAADVVVQFPDGSLALADYKTERFVPASHDPLPGRFLEQALLTSFALSKGTNQPIRSFRFLFLAADPVSTVTVDWNETRAREAENLLRRRLSESPSSSGWPSPSER